PGSLAAAVGLPRRTTLPTPLMTAEIAIPAPTSEGQPTPPATMSRPTAGGTRPTPAITGVPLLPPRPVAPPLPPPPLSVPPVAAMPAPPPPLAGHEPAAAASGSFPPSGSGPHPIEPHTRSESGRRVGALPPPSALPTPTRRRAERSAATEAPADAWRRHHDADVPLAAAVVPKGVLPPQPGAGSRQALNTQMLIADIAEELTAEEPNDAAANTGSPNVTQA